MKQDVISEGKLTAWNICNVRHFIVLAICTASKYKSYLHDFSLINSIQNNRLEINTFKDTTIWPIKK